MNFNWLRTFQRDVPFFLETLIRDFFIASRQNLIFKQSYGNIATRLADLLAMEPNSTTTPDV